MADPERGSAAAPSPPAPSAPDPARDQRERARGTWELVVHETAGDDERRFSVLRRVLRMKSFEAGALRARLPGPVRRGARVDLEPLLERLVRLGFRASLERRAGAPAD
jgi:hypothetical protein